MPDIEANREISDPPVSQYLAELDVPHSVFRHPGPVNTLEQAAAERGQEPEQVVRSILFRLGKGEYAMVLMAGPRQISWKALRDYFGRSRLTTAKREEVLQVTGYELGAVSPFGIPTLLRILVDQSVLEQEEVSIGSGERGVTVILLTNDLMGALEMAEVGRFANE
ncbi:MAG: YbaK/EbsC family protein [Candidatus Promineifilaceae bacterium]